MLLPLSRGSLGGGKVVAQYSICKYHSILPLILTLNLTWRHRVVSLRALLQVSWFSLTRLGLNGKTVR